MISPKVKLLLMPKQISLGLAYLGAVLLKAGHNVQVFDMTVEDQSLENKLQKNKFDLVGISATTPLIKDAWEVAKTVKKYTSSPVVIGGPHVSALPEESLRQKAVDLVVRGEGEQTILEICQTLVGKKKREGVLGLSFKKNGKIVHNKLRPLYKDLDRLPSPAYELFKINKYSLTQPLKDRKTEESRAFYIMTSRGCPYGCTYCYKGICGRSWRPMSARKVVTEWENLVKNLSATEIGVQDDVFNLDKKRAMEICELLIERKLNYVPWITNNGIRADKVDLELLQKMKQAGCKRVAFGVESGSQRILNNIQKNLTLGQVRKTFVLAKKAGFETMGYFMFGNPGEDEKTMDQTIKFALELDPEVAVFSVATPFPGSPLYDLVFKKGEIIEKDWDNYGILEGKGFFKLGQVSPALVERKWREAYRRFYLRPSRVWQEIWRKDNWLNVKPLLRAGAKYFT